MKKYSIILMTSLLLCGCAAGDKSMSPGYEISRVAKGVIDEVTEINQKAVMTDLKMLMVKLYKRNPVQRYDKDRLDLKASVDQVFSRPVDFKYTQWLATRPDDIVRLAFDDNYHGDRVLAFIVGLRRMLMASYDNHTEFFYLTSIDPQKLYNSARNIEIAAWLIAEKRNQHGQLFLLSDSAEKESRNLSFQRLIGKMIATQDNLAVVISRKNGLMLKTFVVQAVSMAFLPI